MPVRPRRDLALLLALVALALAVRFSPWQAARAGGLRLLSTDSYGHLRRAHTVARQLPHVPVRDPYLNHPDGAVWIWPPLFDLLVGSLSRLRFGDGVTIDETARVAAAVPPVLGALHLVPLFLLARRTLGRRRALLAVTAYAVLPAAVRWSAYGHADHHVAEVLILLVVLAAAANAVFPGRPRRRLAWTLATGVAVGTALMVWQGAVFAAALVFFWAAVTLGSLAPLLAAAATVVAAAGTALTLGKTEVPFSFVSFGWFQPLLLAAGTLLVCLIALVRILVTRPAGGVGGWVRPWGLVPAVLASLLLPVVLPSLPRLASATLRGSRHVVTQSSTSDADDFADGGYLSYPRELLVLIAETAPLLREPLGANTANAVRGLSLGLPLLPLALVLWARSAWLRLRRTRPREDAWPARPARLLVVILLAAALLAMTLAQNRNAYYLAVFTALALAECAGRLLALVRRRAGRRLPGALAAVLTGTILCVALPGLPHLRRSALYAEAPGSDVLDLLRRLAKLDPPERDPWDLPLPAPGEVPGVMGPWSAGHFVTALARRPAAADTFAYGWRRQCRLFTAPDDAEAEAILRSARCRYLLTTDLRGILPAYAAAVGRGGIPVEATFSVRVHESRRRRPVPFLELALDSRTAARASDGGILPRFRIWRVLAPDAVEP